MYKHRTDRRAFTLVEMAIVLALIGILVGGSTWTLRTVLQQNRRADARLALENARDALVGFAAQGEQRRLPNASQFRNLVPQREDPWRNDVQYWFADTLEANVQAICEVQSTGIALRSQCAQPDCSSTHDSSDDLAFLIWSTGPDGRSQVAEDPAFRGLPAQGVGGMDDLAIWMDLGELQERLACSRRSDVRILNRELPYGIVGEAYSATIVPEGVSGAYEWCVEPDEPETADINGIQTLTDGGGNPLTYPCVTGGSGLWETGSVLDLAGTPQVTGTRRIDVWVRETDDDVGLTETRHPLALTVHAEPKPGAEGLGDDEISFAESMAQFAKADENNFEGNGEDMIVVDTVNNTITMRDNDSDREDGSACIWYPDTHEFIGNTMRSYFEYRFDKNENDGFTFALIDGSGADNVCGGIAGAMGYSYSDDGASRAIYQQSFAVEFDVWGNSDWDEDSGDNYGDIGILGARQEHEGQSAASNRHAGDDPVCDGSTTSCRAGLQDTHLNTSIVYPVRIEVRPVEFPASDVGQPDGVSVDTLECQANSCTNGWMRIDVWVGTEVDDLADCNATTLNENCEGLLGSNSGSYVANGAGLQRFTKFMQIPDEFAEHGIRFGFTMGGWNDANGGSGIELTLSNFAIRFDSAEGGN